MSDLINIKVSKDTLMKLLEDRLHHWTDEEDYIELYIKKYENDYIEGLFDNIVIDIKELVDNDWCSNYSILGVGDYGFDESIENGDYIEINKNETLILIRN